MSLVKSSFDDLSFYVIYVTLRPVLLQYEHVTSNIEKYLSDIQCGFQIQEVIPITSLVCANINRLTIKQFFDEGIGCTNIGEKISSNLIRVATQRIYSDPYRSFIEPVVNSIDAYNEIHGNPSTTGKFGMGFFSLLFWIMQKGEKMVIESSYRIDSEKSCNWNATLVYDDSFLFQLNESHIVENEEHFTNITIFSKRIDDVHIKKMLYDSFYLQPQYNISYVDTRFSNIEDPVTERVNRYSQTLCSIEIEKDEYRVTFRDKATGISLSTFLTKLLIPSISTKTISRSLTNELTYNSLPSNVILKDRDEMEDLFYIYGDIESIFYIVIRGISMSNNTLKLMTKEDFLKSAGINNNVFREKEVDNYTEYILAVPDQTPLPVSRDDIILSNPLYYNAVKKGLFELIDIIIDSKASMANLFKHLTEYARYANDNDVYRLISEAQEYLFTLEDVYLVPLQEEYFYQEVLEAISSKKYIGLEWPDLPRLTTHVNNLPLTSLDVFSNRKVMLIDDLKDKMGVNFTTAGLISIIFVDSTYTKKKNWHIILMGISTSYLYQTNQDISDKMKSLLSHNIFKTSEIENAFKGEEGEFLDKYDVVVTRYMSRFADLIETLNSRETQAGDLDYLINYYEHIYLIMIYSAVISNNDEAFLEELYNMIYSSLLSMTNRKFPNTSSRQVVYMDTFGYHIGIPRMHSFDISNVMLSKLVQLAKTYHNIYNGKYLLSYMWLFYGFWAKIDKPAVNMWNPYITSPFNLYTDKTEDTNYRHYGEYISYALEYIYSKAVEYGFIMAIVLRSIYKKVIKSKNIRDDTHIYLDFVYHELHTKYGLSSISNTITAYLSNPRYKDSEMYKLYELLNVGIDVISRALNRRDYTVSIDYIYDRSFTTTFTANQLIQYLYRYNADLSSLDWLSEVSKYEGKDVKFQALEIAINEGTSKSYMESIITELTQNSIDAIRGYVSEHNPLLCINDEKYYIISYLNDTVVTQRTKEKSNISCPNRIDLNIGKIGNHYGISLTDYIGIPNEGIIAMMLPFYSTKKAGQVTTTGEMGTGFMNVYRQPYCKEVWVNTSREDGTSMLIKMIPIVDQYNRTIDIQYNISKTNYISRATTVTILLREFEVKERASLLTEALTYSHNFYPALNTFCYINEKKVNIVPTYLFDNDIATVYYIETPKISSIIFTNGVPYGRLKPILDDNNVPGVRKYGAFHLVIDLKKSSYTPQQSRKRILMPLEIKGQFNDTILLASILAGIIGQLKSGSDNIDDTEYEGLKYQGNPNQLLPEKVYGKAGQRDYNNTLIRQSIKTMDIKSLREYIIISYRNGILDNPSKESIRNKAQSVMSEMPYTKVRELYVDMICLWYSNKDDRKVKMEKIPDKEEIKKLNIDIDMAAMEKVQGFLQRILNYAWNNFNKLANEGDLVGFAKALKAPPKVSYMLIMGAGGVYNPNFHTIILGVNSSIGKVGSSVEKYTATYNQNKARAINLIKSDPYLKTLIGNEPKAVTLVHEFLHSLRHDQHADDAHGSISYTLNKVLYRYPFDAAANELWSLLTAGFEP